MQSVPGIYQYMLSTVNCELVKSVMLSLAGHKACSFNQRLIKIKLENVAIANALQLEAARRSAVPVRFNTSPVASLKSLSLSVVRLRAYLLLIRYVTL